MGTNRTNNSLEDRLWRLVQKHDRQLRELKSAIQPVGADIVKVTQEPTDGYILAGPFAIAAGAASTLNFAFTPPSELLTLWDFAVTPYIDTLDVPHQWPSGSSLTAGQSKMKMYVWLDWGDSNDATNVRVFKARFENGDAASHNIYIKARAYIPQLGGVS